MTTKRLLITYYSGTGKTKLMAEEICKGARRLGISVEMKRVEKCSLDNLVEADGIIIGSPTYFNNVAWQVKKLIDELIGLYRNKQLAGKVGGCFTSAGNRSNGEDCIKMMELAFGLHHKLRMVPGIVSASGEREEEVSKMCQEYGMKIAEKLVS